MRLTRTVAVFCILRLSCSVYGLDYHNYPLGGILEMEEYSGGSLDDELAWRTRYPYLGLFNHT